MGSPVWDSAVGAVPSVSKGDPPWGSVGRNMHATCEHGGGDGNVGLGA